MKIFRNRKPQINTHKLNVLEALSAEPVPKSVSRQRQKSANTWSVSPSNELTERIRTNSERSTRRKKAMIAVGSLVAGAVVVAGAFWPTSKGVESDVSTDPVKEMVTPNDGSYAGSDTSETAAVVDESAGTEVNGAAVLDNIISLRASEISQIEGATSWDRAHELYGDQTAPRLIEAVVNLQSQGVDAEWQGNPMTDTNAYISVGGISDTNFVWSGISQALAEQQARDFLEAAGQAA